MELIKGATYLFPAVKTNKPATLARKARYIGRVNGRHVFEALEMYVNGEWMLLDDAIALLVDRGARKYTVHRRIAYGARMPKGIRMIEQPAVVEGAAKKRQRKRVKEDTAVALIARLLERNVITAGELAEALR